MKKCGSCQTEKPLNEFHRRGKKSQSVCKSCRKTYDAVYWQQNKDRLRPKKDSDRKQFQGWLDSLKNDPCVDCGQSFHPCVMDWDHLPGAEKLFSLGAGRKAKQKVLDEIAKCELVCSNCHRYRTWIRHRNGV